MKVFISYSHQDKIFAHNLAEALKNAGYEPWIDTLNIKVGENFIEKTDEGLALADYIVAVLSKSYNQSRWVQQELSAFAMKEVWTSRNNILPVLIEDCEIPVFLQDRLYADFRQSFEDGFKQLVLALNPKRSKTKKDDAKEFTREAKETSLDIQLGKIRTEYINGNLTLFCGAGISMGAGIPPWDLLLKALLNDLFHKQTVDNTRLKTGGLQEKLAELYQKYFNPSPLMIAQYLKNGLGNDFLEHVRKALYKTDPTTSDLINSIVELCRPQRSRESLHSIITFNFDDLIEANLKKSVIKHKSIFREGQRCAPSELPIYHAHGFLPRSGRLSKDHEVVFSEDAYHSQFIDSFSWSNLIQLNHLNQNLCLFVGLSMTDPNLRRLLDVSMRKNPDRVLNHYVFKKRSEQNKISSYISELGLKDKDNQFSSDFMKIAEVLEEQDANNLGLNVIWVDSYDEIPKLLNKLME